MNIGYIGLGALGSELALRFKDAHQLCVWDISASARERMARAGVQVAESPAALARQCEVILLCLPRSADVRQLVFGSGALAEGLSAGKLIIDQTSGTPGETAALARELEVQGIAMLDAAVSANPQLVHKGGATLMVAGPDALLERARPVLNVITERVLRCGSRVGDGQAVKIVNNAIYAAIRLSTLELASLARKAGFSLQQISDAWKPGIARSQSTERMLPALLRGEASTNFALALMLKDLNQAVELGMSRGAAMPVAALTRALLQSGLHMKGAQAQLEDMLGVIETLYGVRLAEPSTASSESDQLQLRDLEMALSAINMVAALECMTAGIRYGLELNVLQEVLGSSSGWSAAGSAVIAALSQSTSSEQDRLLPWAQAQQAALTLALQLGAPVFLCTYVQALLSSAVVELGDSADLAGLAAWYARRQPALVEA